MRCGIEVISAGRGLQVGAGGMPTYYQGLLNEMARQRGNDEVVVFEPPNNPAWMPADPTGIERVRCTGLPVQRALQVAYEHAALPMLARRANIDVLLSTVNVRPLGWRGASVVVLQSMQSFFLDDRIGRARGRYLKVAVPRSLRSADRVISVSEAARQDAIELFELDPGRVVTVHHGPSPWAIAAANGFAAEGIPPRPPGPEPEKPYVLNVSSLYGLKNQARLIEGFAAARRATGLDVELVIAGREMDVTIVDLEAVAAAHGAGDAVRVLGEYPQAHLPALYANATAVAYPSLYETFGHPVLESFAFGRPLLTSSRAGSAEVAGDAAVLVEPNDPDAIAAGLTRLLTDSELRSSLGLAGRRRLGEFSWERTASETLKVLRSAAAESAG